VQTHKKIACGLVDGGVDSGVQKTKSADLLIQQGNSGISGLRKKARGGQNTLREVSIRQLSILGRSPGFRNETSFPSQWRDRAGFSPASLFSP